MKHSENDSAPRRRRPQASGLKDVAALAGVGVATASAVLNGSRSNTRVSEATQKRVERIAKELGYRANALARGLSGRPTKTLGVLFGVRAAVNVANPYAITIFQGLVAGAAQAGYNITLFTEAWHGAERSGGVLRDGTTDGAVLIAVTNDSDIISSVTEFGVPAVAVSSSVLDEIPSIDVDNARGARLATEHLLALGHRNIAHLKGESNLMNAVERQHAFCESMAAAGLSVRPEYMLEGTYDGASGYERTRRMLALPTPPTAVFAANDTLALAAKAAAQECGLSVPEQLSIIGFDDTPILSLQDAGPTTIRQPLVEMGEATSKLLIELIEGGSVAPGRRLFEPELIVRRSTAPHKPG